MEGNLTLDAYLRETTALAREPSFCTAPARIPYCNEQLNATASQLLGASSTASFAFAPGMTDQSVVDTVNAVSGVLAAFATLRRDNVMLAEEVTKLNNMKTVKKSQLEKAEGRHDREMREFTRVVQGLKDSEAALVQENASLRQELKGAITTYDDLLRRYDTLAHAKRKLELENEGLLDRLRSYLSMGQGRANYILADLEGSERDLAKGLERAPPAVLRVPRRVSCRRPEHGLEAAQPTPVGDPAGDAADAVGVSDPAGVTALGAAQLADIAQCLSQVDDNLREACYEMSGNEAIILEKRRGADRSPSHRAVSPGINHDNELVRLDAPGDTPGYGPDDVPATLYDVLQQVADLRALAEVTRSTYAEKAASNTTRMTSMVSAIAALKTVIDAQDKNVRQLTEMVMGEPAKAQSEQFDAERRRFEETVLALQLENRRLTETNTDLARATAFASSVQLEL